MPPITSPRRTGMHSAGATAMARPMPIPPSPLTPAFGATSSSMSSGTSGTSPSSLGSFRPAPYMVALAGWPEPVFVAEARDQWEKKHSRPSSPTGFREVRDGIGSYGNPMLNIRDLQQSQVRDGIRDSHGFHTGPRLPPLSNGVRDGIPTPMDAYRSTGMSRTASGNVPVDPALRSRGSSPLGRSSLSPDAPSPPRSGSLSQSHTHTNTYTHSQSHSISSSHSGNNSPPRTAVSGSTPTSSLRHHRRVHGFVDPRYGPNAPIIGGRRVALRVAPAWASAVSNSAGLAATGHRPGHTPSEGQSSHSHGPSPYTRGGSMAASAHGLHHSSRDPRRAHYGPHAGHVQRSVPEVWPPPKQPHPPHLATAVYPRDPDSPWMWNMSNSSAGASSGASPAHQSVSSAMHSANGSVSPPTRNSPKPDESSSKDNGKPIIDNESNTTSTTPSATPSANGIDKHESAGDVKREPESHAPTDTMDVDEQ